MWQTGTTPPVQGLQVQNFNILHNNIILIPTPSDHHLKVVSYRVQDHCAGQAIEANSEVWKAVPVFTFAVVDECFIAVISWKM